MNAHATRGELLYTHGRYADAETEFRQALAESPEDAATLGMLAVTIAQQERYEEALATAREAVAHGPELGFAHYALALVHLDREEVLKAKLAIEEALRLEPGHPGFCATLARVHIMREEYARALTVLNQGLEEDPEHGACQNLKALVLTQLGRHNEARTTIQGQLERDPEDAMTHANQGWSLLHANRPKDAAGHFREALRLDPELDYARQGMLNSLRARNPLFRVLLAYALWMSRLSSGARWGVIIGGYLVYKIVYQAGKADPELRWWTTPVVVGYLLLIFLTWTGLPLTNLMLRLDKYARYLLSREEIRATNIVGVLLLLAAGCGIASWVTHMLVFGLAALMFLLLVIPVAQVFDQDATRERRILGGYTALLIGVGVAGLISAQTNEDLLPLFVVAFVLGIGLFTWVANAVRMRKPT